MDPALIFPALTAAISALFWLLIKEKDRQIANLEKQVETLDTKLSKANDMLAQNTTALETSNENDMILASLVEQTMKKLESLQEGR